MATDTEHQQATEPPPADSGIEQIRADLRALALRHRSAVPHRGAQSNERLEFLGDAVLGLAVAEILYEKHPDWLEGDLARARSFLVSEDTLADAAERLRLLEEMALEAAEARAGGAARRSIGADALEAVLGAAYLDQGMPLVRQLVSRWLAPALAAVEANQFRKDYKSMLQERLQATHQRLPSYRIVAEYGKDHNKTFVAQVYLGGSLLGEGSGRSKKAAEQAAARAAIAKLDEEAGLCEAERSEREHGAEHEGS